MGNRNITDRDIPKSGTTNVRRFLLLEGFSFQRCAIEVWETRYSVDGIGSLVQLYRLRLVCLLEGMGFFRETFCGGEECVTPAVVVWIVDLLFDEVLEDREKVFLLAVVEPECFSINSYSTSSIRPYTYGYTPSLH